MRAVGRVLVAMFLASSASAQTLAGAWSSAPSGIPVACSLAEDPARHLSGACEVDRAGGSAAGVYRVTGRRHGALARLAGRRADGVRFVASARLARSRLVIRFRVAGGGTPLAGKDALELAGDGDSYPHWLYETTCGACHGPDGRGLSGRPNVRCDVDVATPIRTGLRGGMPAFPAAQLDDASVAAIETWLAGACADDPPDVLPGDLYAANCARCHGAQAEGGHTSDGVTVPSVRCRDTAVILGEMASGDDPMPAFPQFTAAERDAIVGFVHGLCPVP